MNILLLNTGNLRPGELSELINELNGPPYMAASYDEAVSILAAHPIDVVIFSLRTLPDLKLLKYLNTSYPQIRVLLPVEDNMNEIVSVLKYGRYQEFPTSCRLPELKRSLEAVISAQESESHACL